jgi:hypothetical protein
MDQEHSYIELQFCPSPGLIPIVRRFVATFYEKLLSEPDAASRFALATHELLENAVKFSADGISSIHLGVSRRGGETEVSIRTRNRASEDDRATVAAIADEIGSAPDVFEYYQEAMRESARREDGSGLGLVRVCAEAEMVLECDSDGDELVVTARALLPIERLGDTPEVPDVAGPSFAASTSFDGRALMVRLSGNADLAARSALETLLPRVHSEALRVGALEVVIDFTALEFMNSSCFRHFVSWLSDVQDLPSERQYRIRLLSSPAMLWQRRSLHALRCFAHDLVSIEG